MTHGKHSVTMARKQDRERHGSVNNRAPSNIRQTKDKKQIKQLQLLPNDSAQRPDYYAAEMARVT